MYIILILKFHRPKLSHASILFQYVIIFPNNWTLHNLYNSQFLFQDKFLDTFLDLIIVIYRQLKQRYIDILHYYYTYIEMLFAK